MEKRTMLDGEEAEIVDSVEEAISISNNSNPSGKNPVQKLLAWQPRCVTVVGRLGTTQTSATSVSRPFAAFARSKVTFSLLARGRITLVMALVGELGELGLLEV